MDKEINAIWKESLLSGLEKKKSERKNHWFFKDDTTLLMQMLKKGTRNADLVGVQQD